MRNWSLTFIEDIKFFFGWLNQPLDPQFGEGVQRSNNENTTGKKRKNDQQISDASKKTAKMDISDIIKGNRSKEECLDSDSSSCVSPLPGSPPENENNNNIRKVELIDINDKIVTGLINKVIQRAAKSELGRQHLMHCEIYGRKKTKPSFPKAENHHVHLKGFLIPQQVIDMVKKYDLFWDPNLQVFRRKEISLKKECQRIAANDLTQDQIQKITNMMYVKIPSSSISKISSLDKVELINNFDKALHIRSSVLSRIPLWEQFNFVTQEAQQNYVILRELIFDMYDIPVPKKFKDLVQEYCGNFTTETVNKCHQELKKNLAELLDVHELERLKRKLKNRFGDKSWEYCYKKLIDLPYMDAFKSLLDESLNLAQKLLAEKILANETSILNSKIFDVQSPLTLKLILNVKCHHSLGEYLASLFCSLYYIEHDNSRVVGINIDRSQSNQNAISFFNDQKEILEILKNKYQKSGESIYTPEFLSKGSKSPIKSPKKEMQSVAEREDHTIMISLTNDLQSTLMQIQDETATVEVPLATSVRITGIKAIQMPLKDFIQYGIHVAAPNIEYPGMFCLDEREDMFMNVYQELILSLTKFQLRHEDIKTLVRIAIDCSNLDGNSIYDISIKEEKSHDGRLIKKIHFELKKEFEKFKWDGPIEVADSMKQIKLTDKEIKQCQLELAFKAHEQSFSNSVDSYVKLGFLSK